jgi:hypothetical protein
LDERNMMEAETLSSPVTNTK